MHDRRAEDRPPPEVASQSERPDPTPPVRSYRVWIIAAIVAPLLVGIVCFIAVRAWRTAARTAGDSVALQSDGRSSSDTKMNGTSIAAPTLREPRPSDIAEDVTAPPKDQLVIGGSNTMREALLALGLAFQRTSLGTQVAVKALGSSTAFSGLFDGSLQIGASSRRMNDTESARADFLGIELEPFVVGHDGVAIIVHPDNPVQHLTLQQVAILFSGNVGTWREFGTDERRTIHRLGRPAYSGTRAFFEQRVMQKASPAVKFAPNIAIYEESKELVTRVAADPQAVGYVGVSFVDSSVRAIPLSAGQEEPFVLPGPRTIADGTYPLSRPLLLYARRASTRGAERFLRFVYSETGRAILKRHGFVPSKTSSDESVASTSSTRTKAELPVDLIRIPFRRSSTYLDPEAQAALAPVARKLQSGDYRALVIGNSDTDGGRRSSADLALIRAHVVATFLLKADVDSELVKVEAAGSRAPLASNDTSAGRDANRRVDLYLVPRRR